MHRLPARLNHSSSRSLPTTDSLDKIALRVTGGDDYHLSQRWSGAIHRYHRLVDGIFLYRVTTTACTASRSSSEPRQGHFRPAALGILGDSA
jgi:hypothetical protein